MYEIKAEDTFIQDVNRWSKKVPELWDEIQAITSYCLLYTSRCV